MQYRLNITHDQDMKNDHFVRDKSCTDPERRLGWERGDRWPELTLILTVDPTVNMLRTMNPL